MTLTLGLLYLGWYHWPGWYLADMPTVLAILVGVDVVAGTAPDFHRCRPCEDTPRAGPGRWSNLARAIGGFRLWRYDPLERPAALLRVLRELPLAGSGPRYRDATPPLQPRAAFRIGAALGTALPRWIWAPLPNNSEEADKIVQSAIKGGFDVTARPAYYKPWASGAADLREPAQAGGRHQVLLVQGKKAAEAAHQGCRIGARSSGRNRADRPKAASARGVRSLEFAASRLHRAELSNIGTASMRIHPLRRPGQGRFGVSVRVASPRSGCAPEADPLDVARKFLHRLIPSGW